MVILYVISVPHVMCTVTVLVTGNIILIYIPDLMPMVKVVGW